MNADTPLWKAHDLAEQLQNKIEALPGVERAFVHVDHETSHAPVRTPRRPPRTSSESHAVVGPAGAYEVSRVSTNTGRVGLAAWAHWARRRLCELKAV